MDLLLKDFTAIDNGARFVVADLHVHSCPASADATDPAMTVEALIDAAVTAKVSVLAITDHNTAAHATVATKYAEKYAGKILVLPAVEVTTAHGHLLVYFSPAAPARVQDLLSRIGIIGDPGSRDSHTAKSMAEVITEAERLGGICIAAHIDRRTGFELQNAGYPNWKRDIIQSSGLYGIEVADNANVSWYSSDDVTANAAERLQLLKARADSAATAARKDLACVQGSDAHTLQDFVGNNRRTLLKMNELSFEAFRTALIDPGARVRIQAALPPRVPRILGVAIGGGFLDGQRWRFSDNLNCFIGGRGTGKSTAIRSVAYALGLDDSLEDHDNGPDEVVVYCEDGNGVTYRYERQRGGDLRVKAKEDKDIDDVPSDSFHVEFYPQGALAEVAKNPLKNPQLLQDFLDRHIDVSDLAEQEAATTSQLEQNAALLKPMEAEDLLLPQKTRSLEDVKKKLLVAETGKLKEVVASQVRLTAEKRFRDSLKDIGTVYNDGFSLAKWKRDFEQLKQPSTELTGDPKSTELLDRIKDVVARANAYVQKVQTDANAQLKVLGAELHGHVEAVRQRHLELDQEANAKLADLRKQGLDGTIQGLQALLKQQTTYETEIARIRARAPELKEARDQRAQLLANLTTIRAARADRRKAQCTKINQHLKGTIQDYVVIIHYDPAGVVDGFAGDLLDTMQGTYFSEDLARKVCAATTPADLALLVRARDMVTLSAVAGIGSDWAGKILQRYSLLENLHRLEVLDKPACPVIKVLTKSMPARQIPVTQLSDGQKHTILLTIAMLAESNNPLIIDQPEDDLDNAFVFGTVVQTLRRIKGHRQVIVVTHNANIAVLGDSELILPMQRVADQGQAYERGSIDRKATCRVVQAILEGGELAFKTRQEIYGH